MRFDQVSAFLHEVEELPHAAIAPDQQSRDVQRTKPWVMKAAKSGGKTSEKYISGWGANAWTSFIDLLKACSPLGTIKQLGLFWLFRMRNPRILSLWFLGISQCT